MGVAETEAYLRARPSVDLATQSGPMLVIDGEIHPKFSPGSSFKRRNGVGVPDDHTAVFAISESAVNFHSFARLFRDELNCANALFFDGTISSLYNAEWPETDFPPGPDHRRGKVKSAARLHNVLQTKAPRHGEFAADLRSLIGLTRDELTDALAESAFRKSSGACACGRSGAGSIIAASRPSSR